MVKETANSRNLRRSNRVWWLQNRAHFLLIKEAVSVAINKKNVSPGPTLHKLAEIMPRVDGKHSARSAVPWAVLRCASSIFHKECAEQSACMGNISRH